MPDIADAMSDVLSRQIEEQTKADATFSAANDALAQKVSEAQQKLLEKLYGKNKPAEYPPEVLNIANALIASPRLIPLVDAYLKKLVAAVNTAVDQALSEASK